MQYKIMHKTKPHFLLAICSTRENAEHWIENFDPSIWMDKDMKKEDLEIVES